MFKAILPSKRLASADFTMVTNLDPGKENSNPGALGAPGQKTTRGGLTMTKGFTQVYDKRRRTTKDDYAEIASSINQEQAFNQLLDDLQIPSTLRPKLATMDATVKAAMLKGSQTMALNPKPILSSSPPRAAIRKTRSSETLGSPQSLKALGYDYDFPRPPTAGVAAGAHYSPSASGSATVGLFAAPRPNHARGVSYDATRAPYPAQSQMHLPGTTTHRGGPAIGATSTKNATSSSNISPASIFSILSGTSSTQMDVENVKKLRLLLRNESASWSQEFLSLGGYAALMTRLNEILEVEWREEQHDDQILHELLRCFKALSTSSIGCFALRSSCPTPFVQLVALLYSDKKPGEVATRQLIVDLLLILFDLYPSSSLPSNTGRAHTRHQEIWETEPSTASSSLVTLPSPHANVYSLIRALLLTPAPPPSESPASPISPHAFIESLHRPRIYKTYLQELSDVCRDYFWVFCHPNNTIWVLGETDEGRVEKPRAPGGMTGGVEFEAMAYFTMHLKLMNAIAKAVADLNLPKDNELSAYRFHSDMFLSGLERIILISRKASATYYPTLHLELSRYIAHVGRSGYELPWTISRLIGLPPPALCKNNNKSNSTATSSSTSGSGSVSGYSSGRNTPALHISGRPSPTKTPGGSRNMNISPTKKGYGAPALPSPIRIEPLRFD